MNRSRRTDDLILAAIRALGRNVGTVEPLTRALDVLVVGAGPAGVAMPGSNPADSRWMLLVVDKATFPRDKTCGDGLTTGALRLLDEIGFDVRSLPSWVGVTDTVLVSPTGREVEVPLPPAGAYAGVVPRAELDVALVVHARARGVDVREGAGVTAIQEGDDSVIATLADGTAVTARFVVAGDGHYSPVRRMVEHGDPPALGLLAHRVPPVLHRRRRPPPLGAVRRGPSSRLRVGVPRGSRRRSRQQWGRPSERGVRCPSNLRRSVGQSTRRAVAQPGRAPEHPACARTRRRARGHGARVADPGRLPPQPAHPRPGALRGRQPATWSTR